MEEKVSQPLTQESPSDRSSQIIPPKKSKKRFIYIILGLLIVVGLVLAAGLVWNKQIAVHREDSEQKDQQIADLQHQVESLESEIGDLRRPTETKNGIMYLSWADVVQLTEPADVDKLPGVTPESFKEYFRAVLADNTPDENGCRQVYYISEISQLNIAGDVGGAADKNGDPLPGCGGGAAMFWYIDNGQWHEFGTQSAGLCTLLAETNIYSEFIPQCVESENSHRMVANPNGSLADALRSQ